MVLKAAAVNMVADAEVRGGRAYGTWYYLRGIFFYRHTVLSMTCVACFFTAAAASHVRATGVELSSPPSL